LVQGLGSVHFYQAYCSPLHTRHALLSHYRQWTNKFSSMKVYWKTCSHCQTLSKNLHRFNWHGCSLLQGFLNSRDLHWHLHTVFFCMQCRVSRYFLRRKAKPCLKKSKPGKKSQIAK